jgi:uncharacterized membrane protein
MTLFTTLLILHIIGGFTGLITGTINLIRRKGDPVHRLVGKIFTWSMFTTGFSSLALATLHPNHFLFMIGVFTIYLVGTGNRCLSLKMLLKGQRPSPIDWILSSGMLIAGVIFVILGTMSLFKGNTFGIVFLVFGGLGLLFVRTDITSYRGRANSRNYWLRTHLQRMTGAYIAAMTAFLVVNIHHAPFPVPSVLAWLLPTMVLTPMIVKWSRRMRVKV